jgi:hypothetical protein
MAAVSSAIALVKYARVSTSSPTVYMWCAHTSTQSYSVAVFEGD